MKNTCSFKWIAWLLAMIIILCMGMTVALAANGLESEPTETQVMLDETILDAKFVKSFIIQDSKGKEVKDFSTANPNESFKLVLEISEPENQQSETNAETHLPEGESGVYMVYQLENMTAVDGKNDIVNWEYEPESGKLYFDWVGNVKQSSFTAIISVSPAYPADQDLSGSYALGTKGNGSTQVLLCSHPFMDGNRGRLTGSVYSMVNGLVYAVTDEDPIWELKHVSGDYYSVYSKNKGQYLKIVPSTNGLVLEDVEAENAQKFLLTSVGNGYYTFTFGGKGINNSSFNAEKGFASYNAETGGNAVLKLFKESEIAHTAVDDRSGEWVIVNTIYRNIVSADKLKEGRLTALAYEENNGKYVTLGNASVFTFENVNRDWYTVKVGNGYLNITSSGATITSNPQRLLVKAEKGTQNVILSTGEFVASSLALTNIDGKTQSGFGASGGSFNDKTRVRMVTADTVWKDTHAVLSFNLNGGSGDIVPASIDGFEGDIITLPDLKAQSNGTEFIGWSDAKSMHDAVPGTKHTYHDVYKAGSQYTLKNGETTLYAIYNEKNKTVRFGIRADGVIQDEPNGYDVSNYIGHFEVKGILKEGHWVIDIDSTKEVNDYYLVNNVTANLTRVPTAEEIAKALLEEGNRIFDPETMYVHWYVMKYAGRWKVDGVIRTKDMVSVTYNLNVPEAEKQNIKAPGSYQVAKGTDILIGAEENSSEVITPIRDGYLFNGWNTKQDGTGNYITVGNKVHLEDNLSLYAQWVNLKDTTMTIQIRSDWPFGQIGHVGSKIKMDAILTGFEGRHYTLQWQHSTETGEWVDEPGANDDTYTYTLNETTTNYRWRVVARDIY